MPELRQKRQTRDLADKLHFKGQWLVQRRLLHGFKDEGRVKDDRQEKGIRDRGLGTGDRGPGTRDQGPGIHIMIDKIDRPKEPKPYEITKPKDAKEDQHHEPDQREEQEKRYQDELAEEDWGKFDRRQTAIRPLRVSKEQISRCLLRSVYMHSGVCMMVLDVVWKDGRKTQAAVCPAPRLEDYIRLKKIGTGHEVPEEFWARGAVVDLGIPQSAQAGGLPEKQKGTRVLIEEKHCRIFETMGLIKDGKFSTGMLIFYIALMALIAALGVLFLR